MKYTEQANVETENRIVVSKNWSSGGDEVLKDTEFLWELTKMF